MKDPHTLVLTLRIKFSFRQFEDDQLPILQYYFREVQWISTIYNCSYSAPNNTMQIYKLVEEDDLHRKAVMNVLVEHLCR